MFWSLISGVTFWSLFESLTLWVWASNRIPSTTWGESPIYLSIMLSAGVIFWSTLHFWTVHRALHWKPLYQIAHERHHRNVNIGPWSGISFHPIEHIIYFTVFLIWWVVPVHPIVIIVSGFYNGLSPAFSHSGFDYIVVRNKWKFSTGNLFHQLHHRYFEVNYGNIPTPLDAHNTSAIFSSHSSTRSSGQSGFPKSSQSRWIHSCTSVPISSREGCLGSIMISLVSRSAQPNTRSLPSFL